MSWRWLQTWSQVLAFCKKNPQEGCGSSRNPAELFSLSSPFHKRSFGVQWILEPSHLGVQVGVFWMQRVIAAASSYKPRVWHKTLSLCSSTFPMLLVTQKGSYGEEISAGLTKRSRDRTKEKRNIQWSQRVQAGVQSDLYLTPHQYVRYVSLPAFDSSHNSSGDNLLTQPVFHT